MQTQIRQAASQLTAQYPSCTVRPDHFLSIENELDPLTWCTSANFVCLYLQALAMALLCLQRTSLFLVQNGSTANFTVTSSCLCLKSTAAMTAVRRQLSIFVFSCCVWNHSLTHPFSVSHRIRIYLWQGGGAQFRCNMMKNRLYIYLISI